MGGTEITSVATLASPAALVLRDAANQREVSAEREARFTAPVDVRRATTGWTVSWGGRCDSVLGVTAWTSTDNGVAGDRRGYHANTLRTRRNVRKFCAA